MARSLRTAAVLSLCAILVPTGCDSPTSSFEVRPSAAITGDGTVVVTVKDVVPIDAVAFAACLNSGDGELVKISGELGVVHNVTLTPASGGKTYLMNLDTRVWSQGIRGIGLQSETELLVVGVDKVEGTEEVTLPHATATETGLRLHDRHDPTSMSPNRVDLHPTARILLEVQIADDFGITTTLDNDNVEIVCPPPADADDGTVRSTTKDVLSIAEEVITPCFNDGKDETVVVTGELGVLHQLTLEPVVGKDTYLMDLVAHVWSQGIQVVLQSGVEALAVGADRADSGLEVAVPTSVGVRGELHVTGPSVYLHPITTGLNIRLTVEITEDFGITTTLDDIGVICPPPPVVDG